MQRIGKAQLDSAVEFLNKLSKRRYRLDGAYGGYKLIVTFDDSSGVSDVTYGYVSKPDLYYQIWAIIRYHEKENSPSILDTPNPASAERLVTASVTEKA